MVSGTILATAKRSNTVPFFGLQNNLVNQTNTNGLGLDTNGNLIIIHSSFSRIVMGAGLLQLAANGQLGFCNSNDASAGTIDTLFVRESAAVIQQGADAASPVAQKLKSCDGSGTDKDGATYTFAGGLSTGTGRGGALVWQTSLTSTTGSTANSYSNRAYVSAKEVSITKGSDVLFCNIAVAASKYVGAILSCTISATDGTDFQCLTSDVRVDAYNKAGTVAVGVSQTDGGGAKSTGTIAATYTVVANGASVDIKVNANPSITPTTCKVKWAIVSLNSDDVGTVTPS